MVIHHLITADGSPLTIILIILGVIGFIKFLQQFGKPANRGSGSRDHISGVDPDED